MARDPLVMLHMLLRQGECAQDARTPAERGGHDILLHRLVRIEEREIAIQSGAYAVANHWEELPLLHHPAAEDDALRGKGVAEVDQSIGEIVRFERPRRMIDSA